MTPRLLQTKIAPPSLNFTVYMCAHTCIHATLSCESLHTIYVFVSWYLSCTINQHYDNSIPLHLQTLPIAVFCYIPCPHHQSCQFSLSLGRSDIGMLGVVTMTTLRQRQYTLALIAILYTHCIPVLPALWLTPPVMFVGALIYCLAIPETSVCRCCHGAIVATIPGIPLCISPWW